MYLCETLLLLGAVLWHHCHHVGNCFGIHFGNVRNGPFLLGIAFPCNMDEPVDQYWGRPCETELLQFVETGGKDVRGGFVPSVSLDGERTTRHAE